MLFAHSVFDVLDPRLNVPSAKIVIEIDTQHREHLIRRHMSSPHFADFTYVRFALGNITDGTDELRARPLANQKAFGFPRENNRHYDQHDPDQDRTRAVPPRIACDQRSSDSGSRSEEHKSELQSLMRMSYAVVCLKKKTNKK